jgi:hypothetical protein
MSDDDKNGNAVRRASTGLYARSTAARRLRDRKVEFMARKVRASVPWLEPSDYAAARAWAELEILAGAVRSALRTLGVANDQGDSRRLLDDYRKLRQVQLSYPRELGMTPAARMAIKASGTKVALDLPEQMARADEEVINDKP